MARKTDYKAHELNLAELKAGDIIKSIEGKTYRKVLMVTDERIIVEGKSGVVDALSPKNIAEYWLLMVPINA